MFSAVFPNLNEDEIGAMALGHHSFQDGISSLQTYYAMSDNFKADPGYYPFMERPVPKWYHWVLFYCLIPASWYQGLAYYLRRPNDENCIKKHPTFMTGNLRAELAT